MTAFTEATTSSATAEWYSPAEIIEPALHEAWTKAYAHLGEILPPSRMPTRDQKPKQLRIEGT